MNFIQNIFFDHFYGLLSQTPCQQLIFSLGFLLNIVKSNAAILPTFAPTLAPVIFGEDLSPATLISFQQMSPILSEGIINMCNSIEGLIGVNATLSSGSGYFLTCPAKITAVLGPLSVTSWDFVSYVPHFLPNMSDFISPLPSVSTFNPPYLMDIQNISALSGCYDVPVTSVPSINITGNISEICDSLPYSCINFSTSQVIGVKMH